MGVAPGQQQACRHAGCRPLPVRCSSLLCLGLAPLPCSAQCLYEVLLPDTLTFRHLHIVIANAAAAAAGCCVVTYIAQFLPSATELVVAQCYYLQRLLPAHVHS